MDIELSNLYTIKKINEIVEIANRFIEEKGKEN